MKDEASSVQPASRHLVVGLELTQKVVRVFSVSLVDKPMVQLPIYSRALASLVELPRMPTVVQTYADPRESRSTYRKGEGHYFGRLDTGIVHVGVPFVAVDDLPGLRIRLADTRDMPLKERNAETLREFLAEPARGHVLCEVVHKDLATHADWLNIARALRIPTATGYFEIYRDKAKHFRWRLCKANDEILADSGGGYDTLAQCESDLRWVREHAPNIPVKQHP
jgi:uncharacterized protein YegP (UPF0339 family)